MPNEPEMSDDRGRLLTLQYLSDAKRLGSRTASLKIQSRTNTRGELLWRIGMGPWATTLPGAIDDYRTRWDITDDNLIRVHGACGEMKP